MQAHDFDESKKVCKEYQGILHKTVVTSVLHKEDWRWIFRTTCRL